jgi:type II secretory pathway pseudopilin PulG
MNYRENKKNALGFSLIETAIALVILGLIALAFTYFARAQIQSKVASTERDLTQRAQSALQAYAYTKFRLPCPASNPATGLEDCTTGAQAQFLPWATLQISDNRARQMRYGVYRSGNANPRLDTDLASSSAMDRAAVLITSGVSATTTPFATSTLLGNANLLDFCHSLNTANSAPFSSSNLHTVDASGVQKNVAYALALPGLGDADGDGNVFDGLQPLQTVALPAFDAPSRPISAAYDDKVVAVSAPTLFANLSCGLAFAAVDHTHFNAASAARIMQKGYYDYQVILDINAVIAAVNVVGATAGVASATAGVASATAAFITATADAVLKEGVTTPAAVLAGIGLGIAAVGLIAAGLNFGLAGFALGVVSGLAIDFRVTETPRLEAIAQGSGSVEDNARFADRLGY